MAEKERIVVKSDATPTLLNKEMAIGWFGGIAVRMIERLPAAPFIGAAVGGLLGMIRMERESGGKTISNQPSFWNKDTLLGGLIGNLAGVAAVLLAPGLGLGVLGVSAAIGATTLLGIYLGSRHGQMQEFQEFQQGKLQQISKQQKDGKFCPEPGLDKSFTDQLDQERQAASLQR